MLCMRVQTCCLRESPYSYYRDLNKLGPIPHHTYSSYVPRTTTGTGYNGPVYQNNGE